MELVLYYIVESRILLITFLIFVFAVGGVCLFYMRDFNQDKKSKVIFYGLLLQMNNVDIVRISTVFIKTFIVIYGTLIFNQTQIFMCIIILAILTIVYIICAPKKTIYEIVCTFVQIAMIYLINIINNYEVESNEKTYILIARIILISFALIFTTYLFFREIDIISRDRENKRLKRVIKEENKIKKEEIGNA